MARPDGAERWAYLRDAVIYGLRIGHEHHIQAQSQAGLEIEQIYGDWEGAPVGPDSRRMIIVARRKQSRVL